MKQTLFAFAVMGLISSCKVARSLIEMQNNKAKIFSYTIDNREIVFLPMHHLGKKEFYNDVKQKVDSLKQKGFIVYYELVIKDRKLDSLQNDTIERKYRKITGISGTYADLAKDKSFLKNYIQQPGYKDLGLLKGDVRADVNTHQFIDEWEKQYGVIVLDSIDKITPLNESAEFKKYATRKQLNYILLKYRNEFVSNLIKTSNDSKILVIYGADHRKDLLKRLKRK